jgi:hypothetical protein
MLIWLMPARGVQGLNAVSSVISIVISSVAVAFSLFTWREHKTKDRRDLLLSIHERLIDVELQRGRRVLYQRVNSVEEAETLLRESPDEYDQANRALSMMDLAALYVEHKYIDRQAFLEEWGPTYAHAWKSGQHLIAERINRQEAIKAWPAWPHFQLLAKQCAEMVPGSD